jgi:AraC-like DNA-binding protein/mannose-6-phosphate isomerase-like protein (cupin superfamily)
MAMDSVVVHPIMDAMRDIVIPNLEGGVGRFVPGEGRHFPHSAAFSSLFGYGMHYHDNYEWVWLLEGTSHISIAGSIHQLFAGDFCLLPPRTVHAEVYTPSTQPYRAIWCSYSAEALYCHISSFVPVGKALSEAKRAVQAPPSILTLLSMLEDEMNSEQSYAGNLRHTLLLSLVHLMMRALESSLAAEMIEGLQGYVARRVMNYLNRHYATHVSLDSVGRAVGMSRNFLCSEFKREAGKTIGEALTEIRLGRAKLLLLGGSLSVQEVARAVGYASPEHFSRIFQRHEHTPPSRYGK